MRFRSAWSRGLCYGGIFAVAIGVFPLAAAVFGNAPLGELALASGLIVFFWGGLGFLAGYASHAETNPQSPAEHGTIEQPSLFKRLLYRFVAGLLLSYLAAMLASGVLYAVVMGIGLDETPARRVTERELRLLFVATCGAFGMYTGAIAGCWAGAMLTRGGNVLRPIAKVAFLSSLLGGLVGGWLAGGAGGSGVVAISGKG